MTSRGAWRVISCFSSLLVVLAGCTSEDILDASLPSLEPAVFVVNSLGWTLSRVVLANGAVVRDAVALGAVPNTIAIGADGHRGYVACSGSNRIDVLDLDELRPLTSIDIGPNSSPFALALVADQAYVSCFRSDEVVHVDLDSGGIVRRIPVGIAPEGVIAVESAGGSSLFVALTGFIYPNGPFGPGEVAVVAVAADTVSARLRVGTNPQALALAPDGMVHVICTGDDYGNDEGRVFVIDPAVPAVVDSLDIGGSPCFLTVLPDGRGVAAGYYGGLRLYDRRDRSVQKSVALGTLEGLADVAFDRASGLLYVANFIDSAVHTVDLVADSLIATHLVGHGPVDLAIRR